MVVPKNYIMIKIQNNPYYRELVVLIILQYVNTRLYQSTAIYFFTRGVVSVGHSPAHRYRDSGSSRQMGRIGQDYRTLPRSDQRREK